MHMFVCGTFMNMYVWCEYFCFILPQVLLEAKEELPESNGSRGCFFFQDLT